MISYGDDDDVPMLPLTTESTEAAQVNGASDSVPATEIAKAVRAAKKKKRAKKAVKAKAKGRTAPAKKAAPKSGRSSSKKPSSKSKPTARNGDAAYGKRVRAARLAKGLSQKALAVKMGVGQPSICNIEKGTIAPGIALQRAFKKYLKIEMTKECVAAIERGATRNVATYTRAPRTKPRKKPRKKSKP